jgi:hypothetical protein
VGKNNDKNGDKGSYDRKYPGSPAAERERRARICNEVQLEDLADDRALVTELQIADYLILEKLVKRKDD